MHHPETQPPPFTLWPGVNGTLGVALIALSVWPWSNTIEGTLFVVLAVVLSATGGYFLAAGAVARGILAAREHTPPGSTPN